MDVEFNVNDIVLIKDSKEKGQILYADNIKKTYLVAKHGNRSNIQFYNISKLEKIKK